MHRNLDRRVEALVEVTDDEARAELRAVLALLTADDVTAWQLSADGSWHRRMMSDDGRALRDAQSELIQRKQRRAKRDT
jgi:polyphosphate kinase